MKKKLTILLFGLLIAVGWTSDAQAQLLLKESRQREMSAMTVKAPVKAFASKHGASVGQAAVNGHNGNLRANAPHRSQNFSVDATVTHTKKWYEDTLPNPNVTWDGGSQLITKPFTDVDGMIALVKRVYTDENIPGAKFSAPQNCDIPYQTIQYGWDILGTNYDEGVTISVNSNAVCIFKIHLLDGNGQPIREALTPSNTTFPSSTWYTGGNSSYWYTVSSSGGSVNIPGSWLVNETGYAEIVVVAEPYSSSYNGVTLTLGNSTFGYSRQTLTYSDSEYSLIDYIIPGTITPPIENGYTVLLVKLYDGLNSNPLERVQDTTVNAADLRNYFQTYIKEVQLLTDGLRVNEGTNTAGTLFAYTGDLNRFYFIGKGKMAFLSSLDVLPHYDRAPFYSMYEEFSPAADSDTLNYTDFYEQMKTGVTYPIVHDCNSVNFFQHYFSMSGKQGTTENRVNSLVFYIPDYRGGTSDDWRTYVTDHQPTVGIYMIDLYADIEPSATQTDVYTATVTWHDNLDAIAHNEDIPQTYYLYQIIGNDTICLTPDGTTQTSWTGNYPVGDPSAYDVHYYVIGTPTAATNKDVFFAKSNTDDVTVPGKTDFVGLQWWRYESDYVTKDAENTEVNYYRNWLAPHALSVQGEAGITAGNVGTQGRTLTLYRNDGVNNTPVIDLELVMNGNKAYYRIKYRPESNQVIEPGYGSDGEPTRNSNN